jgi:hypothetical protein
VDYIDAWFALKMMTMMMMMMTTTMMMMPVPARDINYEGAKCLDYSTEVNSRRILKTLS